MEVYQCYLASSLWAFPKGEGRLPNHVTLTFSPTFATKNDQQRFGCHDFNKYTYIIPIAHIILWYLMIPFDTSWYLVMPHDTPWACNPHDSSWYIKIAPGNPGTFHDASWNLMIHASSLPHDASWFTWWYTSQCYVTIPHVPDAFGHVWTKSFDISLDRWMTLCQYRPFQRNSLGIGQVVPSTRCGSLVSKATGSLSAFVATELPCLRWCCWKRRAWAGII